MKKYIALLLVFLLFVCSCRDFRYDNMIDDSIYFMKNDLQEVTIPVMNQKEYVYQIMIHKAGFFQNKFSGHLSVDYDYLVRYNTTHKTDYEMLSEDYFSFDDDFVVDADSNEISIPITINLGKLVKDKGYNTYYIPLAVSSLTANGSVSEEKSNFLLAITLNKPVLSFLGDMKGARLLDFSNDSSNAYQVDISSFLDMASSVDLGVNYNIDSSLVDSNEHILKADFYSFQNKVTIPVGKQKADNSLKINIKDMPRGKWIVPVRLSTKNSEVSIGDTAYLKLTLIKGTLDDIQWSGEYLQGNEIIVPSQVLNNVLIATEKNGGNIELLSNKSWIGLSQDNNGNIFMNITSSNPNTTEERVATVTIKDKDLGLEKSIQVRQGMDGFGVGLNKSMWSIPSFSDNVSVVKEQLARLYNNSWPSNKNESSNSYVEFNNRSDASEPFVLVFDLGEQHKSYNSLGMMPRLQWVQPSPKQIKVEVSDDMDNWTVLGPNAGTNGKWDAFTESELQGSTGSWEDHYNPFIVHWFDLGKRTERYIRISIYNGFYQDGKVVCLNEIFVGTR